IFHLLVRCPKYWLRFLLARSRLLESALAKNLQMDLPTKSRLPCLQVVAHRSCSSCVTHIAIDSPTPHELSPPLYE
ncbi:hypothetical protein EDD17DRAFT_1641571, partial [Pisolithus thermaeus]